MTRGVVLFLLLAGCAARRQQVALPDAEQGRKHFHSYCAACHAADGRGSDDTPPLAGSSWVAGPETRLIKIALDGVRGPMEVNGKTYDREMPGFGQVLSDADVASLLSFIRKQFGATSESVSPEAVGRIRSANRNRTDYWSTQELLAEP